MTGLNQRYTLFEDCFEQMRWPDQQLFKRKKEAVRNNDLHVTTYYSVMMMWLNIIHKSPISLLISRQTALIKQAGKGLLKHFTVLQIKLFKEKRHKTN